MGDDCFAYTGIKDLTWRWEIEDVPMGLCMFCVRLLVLDLADSARSIGARAFAGCALQRVDGCGKVSRYGSHCFANCPSLLSVDIPKDQPTRMERGAFVGCGLLQMEIPVKCELARDVFTIDMQITFALDYQEHFGLSDEHMNLFFVG
jgi:hypothetical protein